MKKTALRFLATVITAIAPAIFAATIPNPSFETDTFTVSPGYVSGNSPITGWTNNNPNRVGINPSGGSPFADNGTIPAGSKVAFIQSSAAETPEGVTLSTVISSLVVGTTYKVSFRVNGSTNTFANLGVEIDGVNIVSSRVGAVGGTAPYNFFAFDFTATATSQTLTLRNSADGDTTVLVDDFSIAVKNSGWSFAAWNDDATSGVDSTKSYTHAFNFGSSVGTTINTIEFTGVAGANPSGPTFSTAGLPNVFANDVNNVIEGSRQLANDFIYAGAIKDESITLNGLLTGAEYIATIYSVGFDNPPYNRAATFSVGNDRLTVNQTHFDNNNGIRISYRFVATGSSITLTYTRLADASIHTYGFSNQQLAGPPAPPTIISQPASQNAAAGEDVTFTVSAVGGNPKFYQWRKNGLALPGQTNSTLLLSAVTTNNNGSYSVIVSNSVGTVTSSNATLLVGLGNIANRSFEADTFIMDPGYVSLNGPITGWNALDGHGINPGPSSPFADNGTIPNGRQVAFLQADGPLSQLLNGFTVGSQYYVVYSENARSGGVPSIEVKIGDTTIVPVHPRAPVGGGNPYIQTTSDVFTASAASLELAFIKSNPQGGDTTALIDNVLVFPLAPSTPPTITAQTGSQTVNVGDTVTFSVTAFGSAPLAYQWSKNGVAVTGATNRTLVFPSVVECDSGDYSAVVSNGFGQATNTPASLLVAFSKVAGIFGTGLNADSTLADNGTVDLHYILGSSIDPSFPGPDAIVVTDGQFPIPPWVASG
ncbi:MAG: immunoglobulin domain-containing protein, partial [Verrucomicrobiota bacterium]